MKLSHHNKWLMFIFAAIILFSCAPQNGEQILSEGEPIVIQDLDITTGQTIFVPAYSEVNYAAEGRTLDLDVTLSIHNTDFTNPIIITSVRYFNTQGQLVREYLPQPQRLGPMASVDFYVNGREQTGGVGTNFIVEWVAEQPVYEPIVETLMLSTSGTQGLSFTSPGRVIKQRE